MEGNYEVLFGGQAVGKVQVIRQGLYYRFHCRCRLTGDVICRLSVQCADRTESLGVVVPLGDGFGLDTKLAAKKLGEGTLRFTLAPKHQKEGMFVPIYPEEPFAYIQGLKDAYLARKNGQVGLIIPK